MKTPRQNLTSDISSLKALAHPLRVQLLDALSVHGPSTASGLAARLGESSGATSYHLRQLEKHGFVQEDPTRGVGRERWWTRTPGSIELDATSLERGSPERMAGEMLVFEWERNRRALLEDFLRRGEQLGPQWIEPSALSTTTLRLTAAQMGDLRDALLEVLDRFVDRYRDHDEPGARPVQTQINVFPVVQAEQTPDGDVGGREQDSQSEETE